MQVLIRLEDLLALSGVLSEHMNMVFLTILVLGRILARERQK